MRILFILFFLCTSFISEAQTIQSMNFSELQKKLLRINDSIVVVNFWATWCKPCIDELPNFEKLNQSYSSKKVKVILINLDFNSKIKSVAEPFVRNKNLQSETIHITDSDPNTWINKMDNAWSGAIPATIIYNSSHQKIYFNEGQMTYQQLDSIIQFNLKN